MPKELTVLWEEVNEWNCQVSDLNSTERGLGIFTVAVPVSQVSQ